MGRTEIRNSNESAFKLLILNFIGYAIKPFLLIFNILKGIIYCLAKAVFNIWDNIYNNLYERRKYLSKVSIKIVGFVELIILGIFCFQYFYNKVFMKDLLMSMLNIAAATGSIFLLLYLYHVLIGSDQLIKIYVAMTDYYIENCIAQIIKIFGPPRIGKDTTGISITSVLVRFNKRLIRQQMNRIKKICYIFDFQYVNNACRLYYRLFVSPSRNERRKKFIKLAGHSTFKCFLLDRYKSTIDYKELIYEFLESIDNKVDFECKYMFNDGISKLHFLDLLCEYMFLYVRLYVVKKFTFINQPYIEDLENGMTGFVHSIKYESVASRPDVTKTYQDENGRKTIKYKEKVEMPILDWSIINLTEYDTWMNNKDGEVAQMLKDTKNRDWKAFYGHFYKRLYYIQICHDASRTNKLLRELDAFYMHILQRVEIPGARKRVFILSTIQKVIDYIVERGGLKLDDANNKIIYKAQKKIDYYQRLYDSTLNVKYLERIRAIEEKEGKSATRFHDLLSNWNKKLMELIEQLRREHGVIRVTATISDQPNTPNVQATTLRQLIQRDRPLYHESYKIDLYFRMKDSMGRYNHRYMEAVLEDRAIKSQIDIMNVLSWDKRLELSRDIMLQMGYPSGYKFFDITPEEVFVDRYYIEDDFQSTGKK